MKLSKEVKQRIRATWANSFIVKLYGKTAGYTFMQYRLNVLWRPTGRMDIIDLGQDFFLVRFGCKEDHDRVLEKGPWFLGEHFLSIRPWESNFKPSSANVSFVAIWIRLNELPIEYYEPEVLKHIGEAIDHVLRIATHTATETKGRFARLCILVDVEKPLITNVILSGIEQPVSYEGISKLCFSCGRIGHRKDSFPYTIRETSPSGNRDGVKESTELPKTRVMHDTTDPALKEGSTSPSQKNAYGPWLVVTRKRQGSKMPKSTKSPERAIPSAMGSAPEGTPRHAPRVGTANNHDREGKRKAKVERSPIAVAQNLARPEDKDLGHLATNAPKAFSHRLDSSHTTNLPSHLLSPSVKGKKGIARGRAHQINRESSRSWVLSSFYPLNPQPHNGLSSEIQPNFQSSASS